MSVAYAERRSTGARPETGEQDVQLRIARAMKAMWQADVDRLESELAVARVNLAIASRIEAERLTT